MHFDSGQEAAGVTHRLIVFGRSLVIVRYQVVSCLVYKSSAPLCWREFRRNSGHICCSRAIIRQTVESYSVARRSWKPSQPSVNGRSTNRNRRRLRGQRKEGHTRQGKTGRGQGRGKPQKIFKRAAWSSRAIVITAERGDTSSETFDMRTLLMWWMRKNLSNLQTAVRAAARIESHLHLPVCVQPEPRKQHRG